MLLLLLLLLLLDDVTVLIFRCSSKNVRTFFLVRYSDEAEVNQAHFLGQEGWLVSHASWDEVKFS